MVVITLTDVPAKLRGDLSKWMIEINTGVFVGNINARVREEIWKRICENMKNGRASMVFSARGEQGMEFKIHNPFRKIVDFDGIKLVKLVKNDSSALPEGFSKAAKYRKIHKIAAAKTNCQTPKVSLFVVVDIETTGLNVVKDEIIEISAVKVRECEVESRFSMPIKCNQKLKSTIIGLTGITDEFLDKNGIPIHEALRAFLEYIGNSRLVFHNAAFDLAFINTALINNGFTSLSNNFEDTMEMAKKSLTSISSYKLSALAEYFDIEINQTHRAVEDCMLTLKVYDHLKKLNTL